MHPSELRIVESAPLRYLVSQPAEPRESPPLLVFLHGHDEAAPLAIERALTLHGPLARRSAPIVRDAFVVVAPQLPRAGDVWYRHASAVEEIVREELYETSADPSRVYLTGFSFGGNGVFDVALAAPPGRWAALWPVDPTRVPARDPGRPIWLSIGSAARPRTRGFVNVLGLEPVAPAWQEDAPPPAGDRLYLDEGLDHVGSAASAYGDARIYRWLLEHAAAHHETGPALRP